MGGQVSFTTQFHSEGSSPQQWPLWREGHRGLCFPPCRGQKTTGACQCLGAGIPLSQDCFVPCLLWPGNEFWYYQSVCSCLTEAELGSPGKGPMGTESPGSGHCPRAEQGPERNSELRTWGLSAKCPMCASRLES